MDELNNNEMNVVGGDAEGDVEQQLKMLYVHNVADSGVLYEAFVATTELLNFLFEDGDEDEEMISYTVLGSSAKGTALKNADLDIDIDMVFSRPFGIVQHGGLDAGMFLTFVQNVVQHMAKKGVQVHPIPVTRSFSLTVHGVTVEVFPKFRSAGSNRTVINSFGNDVGGGIRFALRGRLPNGYKQPHFVGTNLEPVNMKRAMVVLKYWKWQQHNPGNNPVASPAMFKSYHLPLLMEATVEGVIETDPHFFLLPDAENGTVLEWVVALWRRVAALRMGGASMIFFDQNLHEIDYRELIDLLPPFNLVDAENHIDISIEISVFLGAVTVQQLKQCGHIHFLQPGVEHH